MVLFVCSILLPILYIFLIGNLLITIPQKEHLLKKLIAQRGLRPGKKIRMHNGEHGTIFALSEKSVYITTPEGKKIEVLKTLIIEQHESTS